MTQNTHGALSDLLEDLCTGVFCDVVRYGEVTKRSSSLRMHNTLRNSFAIKVRHFVEEVDILQQDWASLANGLRGDFDTDRRSTAQCSYGWSALYKVMKNSRYAIFYAIICGN